MPRTLRILVLLALMVQPAAASCVADARATVPLQLTGRSLTVVLAVNGIAGRFILDTGAERSVVAEGAVERLGLARDPWVGTTMSGVGGIERRPNANPRSLTLGGLPLVRRTLGHDTSLAVAPLRGDGGPGVDGLLGRDYLSLFDLDLDLIGLRLTLYHVEGCAGRFLPWSGDYAAVPLTVPAANALIVPVTLDGTTLRALLDTGASASLLAAPGMFRMALTEESIAGDPSQPVNGLGSRVRVMHQHTFRTLLVGGQSIAGPLVWVAPIRLGPTADMLLGMDWMAGRRIWLSWATRQLFFASR